MPMISVVIPFYSNVLWLTEAINSVLRQSYSDYEIIVINDGSQEDMSSFIQQYAEKIVYIIQKNHGAAVARNVGIDIAKGQYIAFLDADDLWHQDKLKKQVDLMEKTEAVWSYCGYSTFGNNLKNSRTMMPEKNYKSSRYYSSYIATPCVMVRRDFLEIHNECRFHPALHYGEDVYMWLMINSLVEIYNLPENLVDVRIRGSNAGKSAVVQLKARSQIWSIRNLNPDRLIEPFNISKLYCLASSICVWFNDIIEFIKGFHVNKNVLEFIAKCLFVLPWLIFKLDRIEYNRCK